MTPDPNIPTPSRFFRTRTDIPRGFAPGWKDDAPDPVIGHLCVVFGLGQWRLATVVKVTPSYVFGQYHVASSDRLWVGKGDRTGRYGTDLYIEEASR